MDTVAFISALALLFATIKGFSIKGNDPKATREKSGLMLLWIIAFSFLILALANGGANPN